jgi:hypothetical protein
MLLSALLEVRRQSFAIRYMIFRHSANVAIEMILNRAPNNGA